MTMMSTLTQGVNSTEMILDNEMLKTVKSTSKAIGSKLAELFVNHFLPKNSFAIMITNNMMKRHLIDPKIFLKKGHTVTPPPFMIPAVEKAYTGGKQIVLLEGNSEGK